jgi:hypothetical protein
MSNNKYILSAPEAAAIGIKRRYALPVLFEHFEDKQLRKTVFNYKLALGKINNNGTYDKDLKEKVDKMMKDYLDKECIGWRDIVKREMNEQALKKHKDESSKPLSFDDKIESLLSQHKDKSKPIDLIEKYSSQPSSTPFPMNQKGDNMSDIDSVMSDESSQENDEDDMSEDDERKFVGNPKAWSKNTIKKQLVDNLSKMNQLVGDTIELIDAMEQ